MSVACSCVHMCLVEFPKISLNNPLSLYANVALHINRWYLFPFPLNLVMISLLPLAYGILLKEIQRKTCQVLKAVHEHWTLSFETLLLRT